MALPQKPDRDDPAREKVHREQVVHGHPQLAPLALAQAAAHLAGEKKADDVRILEVAGVCGYADYFVICSGNNERQSVAIARVVDEALKKGGVRPYSVEGVKQGNWALLDYGDVVVHVFLESARKYYDLEGFWSDGRDVLVDDAAGVAALEHLGLSSSGEPLSAE